MGKDWTIEELKYLHDNYADNFSEDIAKALGRSVKSIYAQAYIHDLKKSKAHHEKVMAQTSVRYKERGKAHRYSKGHVPANKGKKLSAETYAKCANTMFKPGSKPHNYKPVGSERITRDGYLERKVEDPGKWRAIHVIVWEEANGPVPAKHKIVHKDKNQLNNDLSNLECLTYADVMRMNSIVRYPADLRFAMKKLKQLKNQIKNGKEQN